jgi:hypothetical protein
MKRDLSFSPLKRLFLNSSLINGICWTPLCKRGAGGDLNIRAVPAIFWDSPESVSQVKVKMI